MLIGKLKRLKGENIKMEIIKQKEEEALRPCELCGKETMGYSNFCMCDNCFNKPKTQRALFSL